MNSRFRSAILGLALASVPLAVGAADGDPKPYPECKTEPSEGDVAAAKGAFQAGQASFNEGDYSRAITYWEDAYRRDCTAHALLKNLARAYELAGKRRHAVLALETFNARNPSHPERDQIQRRIELLNEQIAKEQSSPAGTGPAATAAPPPTAPTGTASAPEEPEPSPGGGGRSALPLYVGIGGGVLAVVGMVLYFPAAADVKDYEAQCPNRTCPDDSIKAKANDARSSQTLGGILTVGGLAVAAGGFAWYFLQPTPAAAGSTPRRQATRVVPVVDRGFVGVGVGGAF
ncbi:MAG: hypothetical protein IT376_03610 [Polyangiaceae bacterium]|nr:hypothetical protein [Polyangiaceae bacterium]